MTTYATAEEYLGYAGTSGPADIDRRLARASERIDELLANAIYDVDDTQGFALDPVLKKAMTQATCAQAAWTLAVGDEFGTSSAFKDVTMGTVRLTRADGGGSAPRYAQDAVSILLRAGFLLAVMTW